MFTHRTRTAHAPRTRGVNKKFRVLSIKAHEIYGSCRARWTMKLVNLISLRGIEISLSFQRWSAPARFWIGGTSQIVGSFFRKHAVLAAPTEMYSFTNPEIVRSISLHGIEIFLRGKLPDMPALPWVRISIFSQIGHMFFSGVCSYNIFVLHFF